MVSPLMVTTPPLDALPRDEDRPIALDLDLDLIGLGPARAMVRELVAPLSEILTADAIQVFDELASNAFLHGQPPRRARIWLHLDRRRLRIEVDDTAPGLPHLRTPDNTGGRGVILIDLLAAAWAFTRHPGHKTVWAEVALGLT